MKSLIDPRLNHSDYIIYVDESGDHGLIKIDPSYPVFVLAFCIFEKNAYVETVVPAVQGLKLKWWGHDAAILHTIDIKRKKGDFSFLMQQHLHDEFMRDLNQIMEQLPFTIVAAIINKSKLKAKYSSPSNPYDIALTFCMERTYAYLSDRGQHERKTTVLVEERGNKEDRDLELAFRRICDGANKWGPLPFLAPRFLSKKANSSGLQIADLVATPIGRNVIDPTRGNRAFDVISPKFRMSPDGKVEGWGRKSFP